MLDQPVSRTLSRARSVTFVSTPLQGLSGRYAAEIVPAARTPGQKDVKNGITSRFPGNLVVVHT